MLPPSLSEDQKIWLGRLYRRLKNVSDAIEDDLLINAPEMLFEYLSNNQCRKVLRGSWFGARYYVYKCNSNKYVAIRITDEVIERIPVNLVEKIDKPPIEKEAITLSESKNNLILEKIYDELFVLGPTDNSRGIINIYYETPIELLRASVSLFRPTEERSFYLHDIAIHNKMLELGVYVTRSPIFPAIILDRYRYYFNINGELEDVKKEKTRSELTNIDDRIWFELYEKRDIVERRIRDALTLIIPPEILRQIF